MPQQQHYDSNKDGLVQVLDLEVIYKILKIVEETQNGLSYNDHSSNRAKEHNSSP